MERGALMVHNLRGVVSRIGIGVAAGALVLSVAAAGRDRRCRHEGGAGGQRFRWLAGGDGQAK
jgi:hypothetical protein